VALAPEVQLDHLARLGVVLDQQDPPAAHGIDASAGR
jgi:hypothetical protein